MLLTYASSFYSSQNIFGWSQFFGPDKNLNTFCATPKDDFHSVNLVTKVFEEALIANKFLDLFQKFGPVQNTKTFLYLQKDKA